MNEDIQRILISEEELRQRIAELGKQLAKDYEGKNPLFVGVLKGVIVFYADMIRATQIESEIDFMSVSSYGSGIESSGNVVVNMDLRRDITGRHIIILEDIIDTGITLSWVKQRLLERNPASLKVCALLDKPDRRKVKLEAEYVGFTIPNEFVVGFGLDYNERYRNLPYVGILKPEVYQK